MIVNDDWMNLLLARLKEVFSDRLLFAGLQGSYQRGEATEESDIDVVVVLDKLTADDLRIYRGLVADLQEGEKVCGFISGRAELRNWPKFELFQFVADTRPYWGELTGLTPEIGRADIAEGLRIWASSLYHGAAHTFLFGRGAAAAEAVGGFYKQSFFMLQTAYYLREGRYVRTKKELLTLLQGQEREILETGMDFGRHRDRCVADPSEYLTQILTWSSAILQETS